MVQPADWDGVFIAHLSAKSTGLSKPNVMGLGRRAAAHDARLGPDELKCSLSRRRMVFAATRRRRTLALYEVTGGVTATASSIIVINGFPTEGSGFSAGTQCSCSSRAADATSIVASFSRNPLDRVGVGGDQRVLGGQVIVGPVRGLIRRLESVKV
jgi:hypothetical protein